LLPDDTKSRFHGEHQELGTGTLRKGQEQRGFWYAEYRGMACVQSTKAEEVPLRWREATANNQQKKSSKAGTKEQEHQGSNLGSFAWSTEAKERRRFCVEHQGQGGIHKMEGSNQQQQTRNGAKEERMV
jgi:hypothetical protein